MRPALLLLAGLLASAGLASASEVDVRPDGGDATATVLAMTTQGNAYCGGTQCAALTTDGNAGCYGPYCVALAEGDAACHALACVASSIHGNSATSSRPHNQFGSVFLASSVYGNAYSDAYRGDDTDLAVSVFGDANAEYGAAISVFGHANGRRGAIAVGGCDLASELCQ